MRETWYDDSVLLSGDLAKEAARIDKGEEILEQIKEIAQKEQIKLASIQALGAIDEFTAGAFYCHLHISAGNEKGAVFGGRLNRAVVSATCEMVIQIINGTADRAYDAQIGLNLLRF